MMIQTQLHPIWSMLTTSAVTDHRQLRLGVVGLHGVFSDRLSTKSSWGFWYFPVFFFRGISWKTAFSAIARNHVILIVNKKLSYGTEAARSLIHFRLNSTIIRKITELHFEPPYGGIRGNTSASYESFTAMKLCSRVSSRECQFYSQNSELAFLSHPLWGMGLRGNVCDSSLFFS